MSTPGLWLAAARPKTLPAAVAPVLVGTALAVREGAFSLLILACALVGSVFIQVGTNLSNDYSDARRGAVRAAPRRSGCSAWNATDGKNNASI